MSNTKAVIFGCQGLELTPDEIVFFRENQPWGFILFGRNIADHDQVRDLVSSLRGCVPGRHAPVLIDQEGGRVQRIRPPLVQKYPSGAELGALYRIDPEKGKRAAWLMSRLHAFDLSRYGIDVDCLPVLDVPVEGSNQVIGDRAYGFDPVIVTDMGQAAADGLKSGGVLPVMKHMPGHGRGFADSHHELPVVSASLEDLKERDFAPFKAMKSELMAMTAHIVYSELDPYAPATTSPKLIKSIIRDYIGFDGLLISDDSSMNALKGTLAERAKAIADNGCDIVLHCNGVMEEMVQVAANVKILSGKSAERADKVLSGFPDKDLSVELDIREEFNAFFAVS
ncbi:MAG: beta-N-acetylhexosaminidase [Pseudomonadota bacterium]